MSEADRDTQRKTEQSENGRHRHETAPESAESGGESMIPQLKREEQQLQDVVEEARRQADEKVAEAEKEAQRRVEEAERSIPREMEEKKQERVAEIERESEQQRESARRDAEDLEKRGRGNMDRAVDFIVKTVLPEGGE